MAVTGRSFVEMLHNNGYVRPTPFLDVVDESFTLGNETIFKADIDALIFDVLDAGLGQHALTICTRTPKYYRVPAFPVEDGLKFVECIQPLGRPLLVQIGACGYVVFRQGIKHTNIFHKDDGSSVGYVFARCGLLLSVFAEEYSVITDFLEGKRHQD